MVFRSVKLDLEARGVIERNPKISPHRLRMKKTDYKKAPPNLINTISIFR